LASLTAGGLAAAAAPAAADGLARGKVGLIDWRDRAYGFSAYSRLWTSTPLTGQVIQRRAGDYIALLVTTDRAYVYKPSSDRWASTTYSGLVKGADASGTTALFWTGTGCYAIASVWSQWRYQSLLVGESVRGGGSAGSFAIVWTTQQGLAYNASSGQWASVPLPVPPVGGIASNGMGLVWTASRAYAFAPISSNWIDLQVDEPIGLTVASGNVGLVWGQAHASAYSQPLADWFAVGATEGPIIGGDAAGDVALVWTWCGAYAFNAGDGTWTALYNRMEDEGGDGGSVEPARPVEGTFAIDPNPCGVADLNLRLPGNEGWRVEIFDVTGRLLRDIDAPATPGGGVVRWNRTDDSGMPVGPGAYWIRAQSGARTEARRIVLLP
jgi:hypothetical protein